jgi:pyrroline-5-carboxylate reductase
MDYGVIGVGAIAQAIVTGLCESVESPPAVVLSPRNAEVAGALAKRYETVTIAASNQAVLDAAPVVLVCLRPQVARDVLAELRFAPAHVVISAMAGISIDELKRLIAPATEVARCIPLPGVARRAGITPVHPPQATAQALFDRLGGAVEVPDIAAYDAFAVATATIAAHFEYLRTISTWLAAHGVAADAADRYVAATFADLATTLADHHDFEHLARDHATVGGINELFLNTLTERGVYDEVRAGMDRVLARLGEL